MHESDGVARCEQCGERLPVQTGHGLRIALARFPDDLVQCYLHLIGNPTVFRCPICTHENEIADAVLCQASEGKHAILYIPSNPRWTPQQQQRLSSELIAKAALDDLEVVHEPRAFRRAFLTHFVNRHAAALNEMQFAPGAMEWVRANEGRLGNEFMSAIWLLLNGAVPVATRAVDRSSPDAAKEAATPFRPGAENTPEFQAAARRQAKEAIASQVARILVYRLAVLGLERCGPAGSMAPALEELGGFCPREILVTEVNSKLVEEIARIRGAFVLGEPGAILAHYLLDAMHALLHYTHSTENPDRDQWTKTLVMYEYARRRDGNDERYLLSPDVVPATVDPIVFFREIRSWGRTLGALTPETREAYQHLVATVERIFPDHMGELGEPAMLLSDTVDDPKILDVYSTETLGELLLRDGAESSVTARMLLKGVAQRRADLLPTIAQRLHEVAERQIHDMATRLRLSNCLIEYLNLYGHYDAARAIAEGTLETTRAADRRPTTDLTPFASFMNEVGNCYRYAQRFPEALEAYDQARRHFGDDTNSRDARVVIRNRAIVL